MIFILWPVFPEFYQIQFDGKYLLPIAQSKNLRAVLDSSISIIFTADVSESLASSNFKIQAEFNKFLLPLFLPPWSESPGYIEYIIVITC